MSNTRKWDNKIEEPEMRIWVCEDGLAIDPDIPIMVAETYFPDIDAPSTVFMALFHRREWDKEVHRAMYDLSKFRSKQIRVEYACSNRTIVNPREYIDKFIYFEARQVV